MNSTKRAFSIFIVIAVMVLWSLVSTHTSYSASVTDIVENASPGIVLIVTYDNTGAESRTGSGFFIDGEGRIMTNALVIKDAYSAKVLSESNYYNNVSILSIAEGLDLALIRVRARKESHLEFDFEYKIKDGEKVVAVGRPFGLKKTVLEGLISDVHNIGESLEYIQTNIPVSFFHTSSDGPLLNMDGKVIGVTTSTISEGQTLNAISLHSIKPFLLKPGTVKDLYPVGSKDWFQWFIKWLFITFFEKGSWLIITIIVVIVALAYLIQFLYGKMKNI
ncbi:MAG: serine protease [Thermodesulfovibrionia bacterium]|nr:serine protease [Thermodesulfovibrionia bacterium]